MRATPVKPAALEDGLSVHKQQVGSPDEPRNVRDHGDEVQMIQMEQVEATEGNAIAAARAASRVRPSLRISSHIPANANP